MMLNKKAQGAEALTMAFGIIVIITLIIVAIVFIQGSTAKAHMEEAANRVDNSITLLNYFRTPTDSEHIMADMIAEYKMTKDQTLKDSIATRSRQILGNIFIGNYDLTIKLDGEEMVKMKKACSKGGVVSQDIMLFDGNKAKVEMICD
jgi:hypothetical protein